MFDKAIVYQWRKYDIAADDFIISRRWATEDAVRAAGGEVLEDTRRRVSAAWLVYGGMTDKGVDPPEETSAFQQMVHKG